MSDIPQDEIISVIAGMSVDDCTKRLASDTSGMSKKDNDQYWHTLYNKMRMSIEDDIATKKATNRALTTDDEMFRAIGDTVNFSGCVSTALVLLRATC